VLCTLVRQGPYKSTVLLVCICYFKALCIGLYPTSQGLLVSRCILHVGAPYYCITHLLFTPYVVYVYTLFTVYVVCTVQGAALNFANSNFKVLFQWWKEFKISLTNQILA
jgi:hypothetical protein